MLEGVFSLIVNTSQCSPCGKGHIRSISRLGEISAWLNLRTCEQRAANDSALLSRSPSGTHAHFYTVSLDQGILAEVKTRKSGILTVVQRSGRGFSEVSGVRQVTRRKPLNSNQSAGALMKTPNNPAQTGRRTQLKQTRGGRSTTNNSTRCTETFTGSDTNKAKLFFY